jgi:hypothetical protein
MKNFKSKKIAFPLRLAFTVMSFFSATIAQAQQAKLITVKSAKSFDENCVEPYQPVPTTFCLRHSKYFLRETCTQLLRSVFRFTLFIQKSS